tara:strand:- start:500 stop:703 length:204 start_codon:yes stop_codon:yes gene_type:complete
MKINYDGDYADISAQPAFKNVSVPSYVHEELKGFCDEHGLTMSGIAGKAIQKYLEQLENIFRLIDKE